MEGARGAGEKEVCDCKDSIEARLLARFKEQAPEAKGHEIKLTGYGFILSDKGSLKIKGCMPVEAKAEYPLKKGGTKSKSLKQSMIFTFCPFCGERYEPVEA